MSSGPSRVSNFFKYPPLRFSFFKSTVSALQSSFFLSHSTSDLPPRSAPAPLQRKNSNFAMAWAASFFFLIMEALSLVCFHTSSLPVQFYNNSNSKQHEKPITKVTDHRRTGNKHITHMKHHLHFHPSIRLNMKQILKLLQLLQEISPRKTTAALQIPH